MEFNEQGNLLGHAFMHNIYYLNFFSERFFHSVHPTLTKPSSGAAARTSKCPFQASLQGREKVTKCPFRAVLQGREVHNSAPMTGAPQTKSMSSEGESDVITESPECKCASSGCQPKGVIM